MMNRSEYLASLADALIHGRISEEAYDAACMNADVFCDDDEED